MASRIMHYVIADMLTKKIDIVDYNRFVFGALAPDISNHDDGSYTIAHIGGSIESKGLKGINWIKFYNKYQGKILNDDFYLGYFVHLIVDAYWLKHIQNKFIRRHPREVKPCLRTRGYRDMYNYNSLLIDKYNLVNSLEVVRNIGMDEINDIYIEPFMRELEKDFTCKTNENVEFEVYPYEEIMMFIQNSFEKCISEISAARKNYGMGNPEEFYVEI
jgi:hypothetical protein